MRNNLRRRVCLALAAVAALALLLAPAAATAKPDRLTPVYGSAIAPPRQVLGSDNRVHLAYELVLTNRTSSEVTIESVSAIGNGRKLEVLSGPGLAAVTLPFGGTFGDTKLQAGQSATVMMSVTIPKRATIPRRLFNQLSVAANPPLADAASTYLISPTRVVRTPAVVVAPPLRGDRWVVGNGCCDEFTAHRGAILPVNGALRVAERFAIDFVQVAPSGRLWDGANELQNYDFFGDPIYSSTAGKVVGVLDGMPETPAGSFPEGISAADAGGNHVVVAMGHGMYAFYAHMQPGSVRVKVGQKVKVGQVLGLLGNSGNSDAPHLHFHIMDGPSPLGSNGIPFRFSHFSLEGKLTNIGEFVGGAPATIAPLDGRVHRKQLPLNDQIIGFG